MSFKNRRAIQEAVLREKKMGTPDFKIGKRYGVTFKYIERLITKTRGLNVSSLNINKKVKGFSPKNFQEEQATVWSFKQRGNWATHSGEYRGNWSPYIPRNVILKYSKPGELVLDCFCGGGTTAIECKLLGRRCIAFDINDKAIELAKRNVGFAVPQEINFSDEKGVFTVYEPELLVADARDMSFLKDDAVDLICTHPPYANIIHYTDSKEGDLSFLDVDDFLKEMGKVAKESFRVLKPGRKCAILIGDTRRRKHIIPLGFKLMDVYLTAGFRLKELVIKRQHNCKTTGFWYERSTKHNFLLLAHEYLLVFEKPVSSFPFWVREGIQATNLLIPVFERPSLKRKMDKLQTTTVWIFPEKEFEACFNKNVIDRYSEGKGYSVISFAAHIGNVKDLFQRKSGRKDHLVLIKSPIFNNCCSIAEIELYLENIKKFAKEQLTRLENGGFLAIQIQDVRINGYIEPLAKRLIDILTAEDLWLKEIVVVVQEKRDPGPQVLGEDLKIVHQYLVVYEVKK
ncbi:MAG: DNA methyltransferase [candidate division WOR-3 bacterium]